MLGVRAKRPWRASVIGVAKEMEIELPPGAAPVAEAEECGLVAVLVVGHDAAGIEPGEVVRPAQAASEAAPSGRKAARGKASSLCQRFEVRRALAPVTHNIDHAGYR